MAGLAEPLRPARIVAAPAAYAPLGRFSCGAGATRWERHVDAVAGRLARGEAIPQLLIVVEDAEAALVGLCSVFARDLVLPTPSAGGRGLPYLPSVPYINAIGVQRALQGRRLRDGSRPGDALLGGVLECLRELHGGSLPHVYALVAPDNVRAQALFERHGFGAIGPGPAGGETIRMRAPDSSAA